MIQRQVTDKTRNVYTSREGCTGALPAGSEVWLIRRGDKYFRWGYIHRKTAEIVDQLIPSEPDTTDMLVNFVDSWQQVTISSIERANKQNID